MMVKTNEAPELGMCNTMQRYIISITTYYVQNTVCMPTITKMVTMQNQYSEAVPDKFNVYWICNCIVSSSQK
jgi:hypothetical protein